MTEARKGGNSIEVLLSAVKELGETEERLLQYGREAVKDSVDDFIKKGIGKLFGLAGAYNKCFQRVGVKTKAELERLITKNSGNRKLREASEELLDFEDEIQAANGEVIVISFGLKEGAVKWLEDTKAPFPMLLDSERKVYHAFGLKRSVYKVWSVNCLVYYAEAMAAGETLPKPYENVHDDTQQMGGDFILDRHGKARFLYPSQTNTDRPAVSALIQQLKDIEKD